MPTKYGKWEVIGSLDEGGQAHLFRVKDTGDEFLRRKSPETDDVFVLKRLKNVGRKQLFEQEIRAILTLQHPNILRIVDYDLEGDKPYYVAEYCKRGSLNKVGAEYFRGNVDRTLEVLLPVIDGLSAAHKAHIVHRDIKPQNILIRGDGSPVIADFGICYMDADERVTLTLTDDAVGSVNYIAPEMESGQRFGPPTPETDAYSLAKVLYWMLSGGKIFSRETHRVRPLSGILQDLRFEHVNMILDDV